MNGAAGDGVFDLAGSGAEPLRAQDPRRIGTIPLVGRLGTGGMGRVYLGVTDGRYAAVKQMLASVVAEDVGFLRRFGQEMDNLARLPAEATAPLLASDRTAEPPWFATAYVPGITLAEAVEQHGALPGDAVWRLLREIAAGLKAVHALDMVHRDLKPSNIMLTLDGTTLIDFGIARAAEQSQLTRTGLIVGTPAYMSPEQATGTRGLTSASDIFTLGLLAGYAAGGRWPFADGAEGSPLYRIVHDEPDLTPVREYDPRLAEMVASCLDKDPEARPTAADLLTLTDRHAPPAPAPAPAPAPTAWPPPINTILTERSAFAKKAPQEPPPLPKTAETAQPPRRERRRTRIALAALPVIVIAAGTTLALQNLPYVTTPDQAAGSTPSAEVTAPTPGASEQTKHPSEKPNKKEKEKEKEDEDRKEGKNPEDEKGKQPSGDGGAGSSDSGSPDGDGDGDGDASSDNNSPGDGDDNASGGDTPNPPASDPPPQAPSTGTFRLKNADTGVCLTQTYGAADNGTCSEASAVWKTVSAENNSFKVVNKESGACLVANMLGQAVFVGDCTQGSSRLWRWGGGNTLKSTSNGGCLDLAYGGGIATATCASGKASQQWART
ncbi:protein kinase [Streptomyces sp. NPDC050658]|uniref:serine/threonine-protein kinase n=1 Tax=unclassified Streptomyces TaxID=2593676 RepID=UPI00343C092F